AGKRSVAPSARRRGRTFHSVANLRRKSSRDMPKNWAASSILYDFMVTGPRPRRLSSGREPCRVLPQMIAQAVPGQLLISIVNRPILNTRRLAETVYFLKAPRLTIAAVVQRNRPTVGGWVVGWCGGDTPALFVTTSLLTTPPPKKFVPAAASPRE